MALALLAGTALYILPAGSAQAQGCWVDDAFRLDFGTVTPAGKEASSTLRYTCQGQPEATLHYRACLYMNAGTSNAIAPRGMTNYNQSEMLYDLYQDAARTQIIGPASGAYPAYTWMFSVPAGAEYQGAASVHGRVHPGQNLPAIAGFEEQGINGVLIWRYSAAGAPPASADCSSGGSGGGQVGFHSHGVYASFANTCLIVAASDLEFGNVSTLDTARDQTSIIRLQCPTGTTWRVGLNEGSHASGGARRMAGPGGAHVRYELYRDSARSQRWGNTIDTDTSNGTGTGATQSLTVHGRVPTQETPAPGTYSDTVTVTLTF